MKKIGISVLNSKKYFSFFLTAEVGLVHVFPVSIRGWPGRAGPHAEALFAEEAGYIHCAPRNSPVTKSPGFPGRTGWWCRR